MTIWNSLGRAPGGRPEREAGAGTGTGTGGGSSRSVPHGFSSVSSTTRALVSVTVAGEVSGALSGGGEHDDEDVDVDSVDSEESQLGGWPVRLKMLLAFSSRCCAAATREVMDDSALGVREGRKKRGMAIDRHTQLSSDEIRRRLGHTDGLVMAVGQRLQEQRASSVAPLFTQPITSASKQSVVMRCWSRCCAPWMTASHRRPLVGLSGRPI